MAGPAAAIFGPVKEWPSQHLKKNWAGPIMAGPVLGFSPTPVFFNDSIHNDRFGIIANGIVIFLINFNF